jgi:hypothetical protein
VPSQAPKSSEGVTARSPLVEVLKPPDYWGAYAIWGATGNDAQGHVWIGITSNDDSSASAHLYEFDPDANTFADRGNVVAELQRLGLRRPGEKQMKIHSRIVVAQDGYQYFSSMDETGEAEDGSKLPTWGGHLWRRGRTTGWEHLAATREALIAVATGGPYVYALGYFNQVLYQFDTRTRRLRSVAAGAIGGHVSRNFFVDARGHAFVSRITRTNGNQASASLVEFDPALTELGAQPLAEYFEAAPDDSHGIVAVHPGPNGVWFFATGKGRLYQIEPRPTGTATLTDLGWFHPGGPRYVASMFRDDRSGALYGVASHSGNGDQQFEWITHVPNGLVTAAPFPYGNTPQFPNGALLYGSMTRDAKGRFYVVGSMNYKPVILRVTAPPS